MFFRTTSKNEIETLKTLAEDLGVDGAWVMLGGNGKTFKYRTEEKSRRWQLAINKFVEEMHKAAHIGVDTGYECMQESI